MAKKKKKKKSRVEASENFSTDQHWCINWPLRNAALESTLCPAHEDFLGLFLGQTFKTESSIGLCLRFWPSPSKGQTEELSSYPQVSKDVTSLSEHITLWKGTAERQDFNFCSLSQWHSQKSCRMSTQEAMVQTWRESIDEKPMNSTVPLGLFKSSFRSLWPSGTSWRRFLDHKMESLAFIELEAKAIMDMAITSYKWMKDDFVFCSLDLKFLSPCVSPLCMWHHNNYQPRTH